MSTATLDKPVTLTIESTLLPLSQLHVIDLKQTHRQAGLDPRDLQYLDAAPIVPRSKGLTFRGVSIE